MIMDYGPVWTSSDFYAMDDQSQFYIELPPDGQGPVWWNAASGTKKDFQDHDFDPLGYEPDLQTRYMI